MLKWIKSIFSSEKPLVLTDEVKEVKKKIETKPLVVKPSFKNKKELSSMTKAKLEEVGRVYGIELDKRLTKDKLVTQLWKSIK
jgi:fructose-1-phosphate kinase PfkB-like protein